MMMVRECTWNEFSFEIWNFFMNCAKQIFNIFINFKFFLPQLNIKMLKEGMKIEARHVRRKQLAQYIDINLVRRERKESESQNNSTTSVTQLAKKRVSAEMGQLNSGPSKRAKLHESVSLPNTRMRWINPLRCVTNL